MANQRSPNEVPNKTADKLDAGKNVILTYVNEKGETKETHMTFEQIYDEGLSLAKRGIDFEFQYIHKADHTKRVRVQFKHYKKIAEMTDAERRAFMPFIKIFP